jgi:hypothetical protein
MEDTGERGDPFRLVTFAFEQNPQRFEHVALIVCD